MKNIVNILVEKAFDRQDEVLTQAQRQTDQPNELNERIQRVFSTATTLNEDTARLVEALYGFKPKVNIGGNNRYSGVEMFDVFRNKANGTLYLTFDTKTNQPYRYGFDLNGNYQAFDTMMHEVVQGDSATEFIEEIDNRWTDEFLIEKLCAMGGNNAAYVKALMAWVKDNGA